MAKQNCWEAMKCGREPKGINVEQLGICPAAIDTEANGLNGGTNAGRLCWSVAGTLGFGTRECTSAKKGKTCLTCDFYTQVMAEERETGFRSRKPKAKTEVKPLPPR